MKTNRRNILKGLGGSLTLRMLESSACQSALQQEVPIRFLAVGNPFEAHCGKRHSGHEPQGSCNLKHLGQYPHKLNINIWVASINR